MIGGDKYGRWMWKTKIKNNFNDMKNINYDLIKTLHSKLDNIWRMEKYYIEDADKAKCHSVPAWKKILVEEKKHAEMLRKEIELRVKAGVFD